MCYQDTKKQIKEKWENSSLVQNQLASIVAIVFVGGGAWVTLSNLQKDVASLIVISHKIDKQTDLNTEEIDDHDESIKELKDYHKYKQTSR